MTNALFTFEDNSSVRFLFNHDKLVFDTRFTEDE